MVPYGSLPAHRWVSNCPARNNRGFLSLCHHLGACLWDAPHILCPPLWQTLCPASESYTLFFHLTLGLCWSFNQVSDCSSPLLWAMCPWTFPLPWPSWAPVTLASPGLPPLLPFLSTSHSRVARQKLLSELTCLSLAAVMMLCVHRLPFPFPSRQTSLGIRWAVKCVLVGGMWKEGPTLKKHCSMISGFPSSLLSWPDVRMHRRTVRLSHERGLEPWITLWKRPCPTADWHSVKWVKNQPWLC